MKKLACSVLVIAGLSGCTSQEIAQFTQVLTQPITKNSEKLKTSEQVKQTATDPNSHVIRVKNFEEEWLEGSGYIARTEKAFNINGRTINLKYAWSGGNNCYVGFYFQEESNFTDIFHNSCYDITTIKTKQEGEKIFVTFQEKGKRKVKYQYNSSNGWVIEIK